MPIGVIVCMASMVMGMIMDMGMAVVGMVMHMAYISMGVVVCMASMIMGMSMGMGMVMAVMGMVMPMVMSSMAVVVTIMGMGGGIMGVVMPSVGVVMSSVGVVMLVIGISGMGVGVDDPIVGVTVGITYIRTDQFKSIVAMVMAMTAVPRVAVGMGNSIMKVCVVVVMYFLTVAALAMHFMSRNIHDQNTKQQNLERAKHFSEKEDVVYIMDSPHHTLL